MRLTLVSVGIELKKILMRKKYIILLLLQFSLCLVGTLFISANVFSRFGINLDVPSVPYILLNALASIVLPLIIFMLASDVFSNEIENGTMRSVLLRPISRLKIYLSKITAIGCYIFINLMLTFLIVIIVKLISGNTMADIFSLLVAYILSMAPMTVFITMASFVSLCLNNSSMAMFCNVILYIVMQGITLMSASLGAIFFTSHLGWYKMFLGISINYANVLNTFFLFLSCSILLAIGGYILLERKEL